MPTRRPTIALLAISMLVAACGATSTSPSPAASQAGEPSSPTVAEASSSASASASQAVESAAPSATATPEPTATPAPTPAPTPVPWKKFTSKRYHYSVKYPPDWIVTKGSSKFADQIDDYASHYVYLSRDVVSGLASLALTASHDKASIKSHYKAKLLSDKKLTVNGWPARMLTFNGSADGRKLFIQHLILAKGKVGYIVKMFSDRGEAKADTALFKKIYKTFHPKP